MNYPYTSIEIITHSKQQFIENLEKFSKGKIHQPFCSLPSGNLIYSIGMPSKTVHLSWRFWNVSNIDKIYYESFSDFYTKLNDIIRKSKCYKTSIDERYCKVCSFDFENNKTLEIELVYDSFSKLTTIEKEQINKLIGNLDIRPKEITEIMDKYNGN